MILISWTDATRWPLRVAAIARSLAIVAGIVLTAMTKSILWLIVGAVVFVGPRWWPILSTGYDVIVARS